MPIREGLARLEGVESIGQRPHLPTATCEVRMKGGRLVDPYSLSNHIFDIRVGARLRGLEATVDGWLEKQDTNLFMRVAGSNEVLRLAPLSRKVQKDVVSKQPLPPTRLERDAFRSLLSKWKGKSQRAQVTGPVLKCPDDSALMLEVRTFVLER